VVESASFAYGGTELSALAEAQNYYRWVVGQFAPFLVKRVIVVGAGIGTFARSLLNQNALSELVLVEPGDNLVPLLRRRFAGESRVKIVHGCFERLAMPTRADSIVLENVLEHIAEDQALHLWYPRSSLRALSALYQDFAGEQIICRRLRDYPPFVLELSRHHRLVSHRQSPQEHDLEASICTSV
jgi:16S rRNA A1518/A1519 N6-dimethyltransferase RsmA/KsgA/DIM1 with predicted DNA glycosylase/AP lyase activity